MKALALAGLMTVSAIAGSTITLSLSQTSFAQEGQKDDGHWTQQHPAGQAQPAQTSQTGQSATPGTRQHTQFKIVRVNGAKASAPFENAVSNAMADGWTPIGAYSAKCNAFDCNYSIGVVR